MLETGAFWFGIVIGFITYRTLRRAKETSISDIATVIGAVGGGAVLALFPANTKQFDYYGIGLAIGFFLYLAISILLTGGKRTSEFLGEDG